MTPLVLVALLYRFGHEPEHFDNIYIASLSISCVFCWRDKDTLGALLLLLTYWLGSKALYFSPNAWHYWVVIYAISLAISTFNFKHITGKITFAIVLYTIFAEIFWFYTEYNRPEIHYYVGLLALTVWVRETLKERVFIADEYFNYTSGKTGLDTHAAAILYLYFGLVLLMILEYFIRHLGYYFGMTKVYYLFTPISTFLSSVTIAVVYMHFFNNQSKKHILA